MAFLTLTQVTKTFGKSFAVEEFNIEVEKGELISFLGPSGCGKTTTLRMVAGFEVPTTGTIMMDGKDITNTAPAMRNVGMVFQAYALFPNLTIAKNIAFGLEISKEAPDAIKERVEEMLDLINMSKFGSRYPFQLSGGQQQRVALARALAVRPQVLLLDEPLSALDAKIRVSLRTEIRSIQKKLGITAIYVTHDQEEALSISDRVVVMNNGRVEQIGVPFEIYNAPKTAFVANFVGTLNTIIAQVDNAESGKLIIGGQEFQSANKLEEMKNGDNVMIALRPELLTLNAGEDKTNSLNVTIGNITFLGAIVRFTLLLGDKSIFMDTFNNPHLEIPRIGDLIRVFFAPDSVLVLKQPLQVKQGEV
jgi:putative spermidine/putrescine transport system ATP-binding protein